MRLDIDWTRCDGHGLCARLLPERISLDEDGFPVLPDRDVARDLLPHARRAVAVCPFVSAYLKRHPEEADIVDRATPAILSSL